MKRLALLLFLLFPSISLSALTVDLQSTVASQEASKTVVKAVERAAKTLFPLEAVITVSIDEFTIAEEKVTASISLSIEGRSIREKAVMPVRGWEGKLLRLLIDQLRYDILDLLPPEKKLHLSSLYRFSYAAEKGTEDWERGQVWGALSSSGKLIGLLRVSSIQDDVVVFETLSDKGIHVGTPLERRSRWNSGLLGGYDFATGSFTASLVSTFAWPYPLSLSLALVYSGGALIAEAGMGVDWPLSTLGDWTLLKNSVLSAAVRFGLGFHPLSFGSSLSLGCRFSLTPAWYFALEGRMEYYASIREKRKWCEGYAVQAGMGVSW